MIAVIDYRMGNLSSVSRALARLGATVKVTSDARAIAAADAIVLPGVGAFQRGMENLSHLNLTAAIYKAIEANKPFLGICLGLQLLFTESEEHGVSQGLNIIRGRVKRFTPEVKIPHMGWNQLHIIRNEQKTIFDDIPDNSYFYFAHSYYVSADNNNLTLATTIYGKEFTSGIMKGNLFAIQFHPEKSGNLGLKLLENFLAQC